MDREQLIEQVRKACAKLQLIITEYDDVKLREATGIRVEYTEKIGQYECKQYELYLHFEEIKHKIEMVQARINRGEPIDMDEINCQVADILEAYYDKLNGMRVQVLEMNGFQYGIVVDIADRAKIKQIYRKLMKMLHPDVCDVNLDFDPELWEKAQDAYKRNDLDTLLMIKDIVGETVSTPLEERESLELEEMLGRMDLAIARYKNKLEEIRKTFPFTEQEHLKNDTWVRGRQEELKKSIQEYEQSIAFLSAALSNLIQQEE